MAEKNNATCSICGKAYYMCGSCRDQITLTPWKTHTDTVEHFKIFQVIRGYSTGVYTKSEAKAKLKNIDVSDMDTLRDNIKVILKDIIGEKRHIKQTETEQEDGEFDEACVLPVIEVPQKEEAFVMTEAVVEVKEMTSTESVAYGETVVPRRRKRFQ